MQLRFVICVPVFNHPKTVIEVIGSCLQKTLHPVLVVDDGSDILVEELFDRSAWAVEKKRVTFIRHTKNSGKGAAILTGSKKAVSLGYTHMITIDADGQHLPEEIEKLTRAAYSYPWALILGDRQMQTQNVPPSSVFGKAFSNFWVKYETDVSVGDSQSGFRIYPLFFLQLMRFLTRRYDFEIEVITRLIWKGVEIKSVPITVVYFPPDRRVTHFNRFKDNFRLTVLNTILVSTSLLKREDSPWQSSLAVALGVFVGTWPVYGLHTAIAAVLALLFRMNFIYLWLGTHISMPPMVPVIFATAHFLSPNLWLGLFQFGIAASLGVGTLVFILKRSMQIAARNKTKVAVKSENGPGITFMQFMLKRFGLQSAYFFLWFIVPYYYLISRRARVSANEYWKVTSPQFGFFQRQKKVLQQLFVFAQVLVDRAYQRAIEKNVFEMIEGEGIPAFVDLMTNSKNGHVILQSHLGGWEMAMAYFRHLPFAKKMVVVMYGFEGAFSHSSIQKTDRRLQVIHFNLQQDTNMKLKSFLDQGDVVGLMGDRPVGRSYEMVLFFGKLALFDTSALRLAQMCHSDLSFIFCMKDQGRKYFVNTVTAKVSDTISREEKVILLAQQYASSLEAHVRLYPEQWFNFFPFWSEKLS